MKPNLELKEFSGPLDLLLSLIKDNKFDINELSLSKVTEQYLKYLDTLEKNKAEELADFLVVGTRLLLLKSRALLPQFVSEEDEETSLEEQLKLYKSFIDASRKIDKLWKDKNKLVFRIELPRKREEFVSPNNLAQDNLHKSMVQLVNRLKPPKPLFSTTIDRAVSMKEKIDSIRNILNKSGKVNFFEILKDVKNRTEVIVSFLALLELVKQKNVVLKQRDIFSNISVEKVGPVVKI